MRNLKRTLSLLLTAAILIGMVVVGASAVSSSDFTDLDEITNIEAAQVMTASVCSRVPTAVPSILTAH